MTDSDKYCSQLLRTAESFLSQLSHQLEALNSRAVRSVVDRPTEIATIDRLDRMFSPILFALRARRNSLCSINRIPPEILAHVFHFVLEPFFELLHDDDFRSGTFWDVPEPASQWLSLMLICRHWRDVMLAFPTIWSDIIAVSTQKSRINYPKYIDNCLQRSGTALLQIHIESALPLSSPRSSLPEFQSVLLSSLPAFQSHAYRIRELSIHGTFNVPKLQTALLSLSDPAPNLERLSIHCEHDAHPLVDLTLPRLFGGDTPRLKRVFLGEVSAWVSKFTTLTHLTLMGPYGEFSPTAPSPIPALLALLEANPNLEELDLWALERLVPQDHLIELEGKPVVQRLRWLSIHDFTPVGAANVLSLFTLPPSTIMNFQGAKEAGSDIFSAFPQNVSGLNNIQEITSLAINIVCVPNFAILTGVGPNSAFNFNHSLGCPHGYLEDQEIQEVPHTYFADSLGALRGHPLSVRLNELWLSALDIIDHHIHQGDVDRESKRLIPDALEFEYRNLFGQMGSLSKLCFICRSSRNALKALLPLAAEEDDIPCQDLQTLMIYKDQTLSYDFLVYFVKERARLRFPIRHLLVQDFEDQGDATKSFIDQLGLYVDVVVSFIPEFPFMEVPQEWGRKRHYGWSEWPGCDEEDWSSDDGAESASEEDE